MGLFSALQLSIVVLVWWIFRRKNRKFTGYVTLLAGLLVITFVVQILLRRLDVFSYYSQYVSYVFQLPISVIIGVLLAFRFFGFLPFGSGNIPDYSAPEVLQESVGKILDSEHFLTALRSTLPKGKGGLVFVER